MRTLAFLLALLPALAFGQVEYEPGPVVNDYFPRWQRGSPLLAKYIAGSNGIPAEYGTATWLGLGTPTIDCVAAAADGELTCTGATMTKAGNPTTGTSPYYYGGAAIPSVVADGTGDYWDAGDVGDATTAFTVCAAFKTSTVAAGSGAIIAKDTGAHPGRAFNLQRNAATLTLNVNRASDGAVTSGPSYTLIAGNENAGCWSYSYVADGTSIVLANVNQVAASASNLGGPVADVTTALRIGAIADGTRNWTGGISRVSLWTGTAATAAQLAYAVRAMQSALGTKAEVVTVANAAAEYIDYGSALYLVPANTPRVVPTQGYAIYGANANAAPQSETMDNAGWAAVTAGATSPGDTAVTADAAVSPTGTTTAEQFATPACPDADDVSARCMDFTATAAIWTGSVYIKHASATANPFIYFWDGTAAYHSAQCAATTTWSRCSVKSASNLSAATWKLCIGNSRVAGQADAGGDTYLVWGAQAEANAIPGPYIPTIASVPVTRGASVYSVVNPVGTVPGPICFGGTYTLPWGATNRFLAITASGTNDVRINYSTAQKLAVITDDASNVAKTFEASAASSFVADSTHRIVACYDPGAHSATIAVDGAPIAMAAASGAGVAPSAYGATMYVGSGATGTASVNGIVGRFGICRSTNLLACDREITK